VCKGVPYSAFSVADCWFASIALRRELTNFPEGEIKEMVEIYKSHNFSEEDARTIVETMAKNKEFFVDHMLVAELGLMPVEDNDDAWKKGLVTFASFVLFGSVPVITYGALREVHWGDTSVNVTFVIACIMTGATLFALGVAKAQITKQNRLKSGALMLVNGGLAAAAAFLIGWGLEAVLNF
jgi:DNA damage-binding protein 1